MKKRQKSVDMCRKSKKNRIQNKPGDIKRKQNQNTRASDPENREVREEILAIEIIHSPREGVKNIQKGKHRQKIGHTLARRESRHRGS